MRDTNTKERTQKGTKGKRIFSILLAVAIVLTGITVPETTAFAWVNASSYGTQYSQLRVGTEIYYKYSGLSSSNPKSLTLDFYPSYADAGNVTGGSSIDVASGNTTIISDTYGSVTTNGYWITYTSMGNDYIRFYANVVLVNFNYQGGAGPYGSAYASCSKVSLPTPYARTGYTFMGWYTGINGTGAKVDNNSQIFETNGQTIYAYWVHNHNWQYTQGKGDDANAISASCVNPGCNYTGTTPVYRISAATDVSYTGAAYASSNLSITNGISAVTGATASLRYYVVDGETATLTNSSNSGAASDGAAPKNVGSYCVKATIGSATATSSFTIVPADRNPAPTVSMADYEFESAAVSTPTLTGTTETPDDVTYYYNTTGSNTEGTAWSTVTGSENPTTYLDPGTYYMYAKYGKTSNYNDGTTAATAFRVKGKTFTGIELDTAGYTYQNEKLYTEYDATPHGITINQGGTALSSISHEDPKSVTPTVKFGTSADSCTQETLTYTDAGEYTIYYKVSAYGYEPVTGSTSLVIQPKKITASLTALDKTYDGTTNAAIVATVDTGIDGEKLKISGIKADFASRNAGAAQAVTVTIDDTHQPTVVQASDATKTTKPSNYDVSYAKDGLTAKINPLVAEFQWDDTNLTYTGNELELLASVSNLCMKNDTEHDDVSVVFKEVDGVKSNKGTAVGSDYKAIISGLTGADSANYILPTDTTKLEKAFSINYLTGVQIDDSAATRGNGWDESGSGGGSDAGSGDAGGETGGGSDAGSGSEGGSGSDSGSTGGGAGTETGGGTGAGSGSDSGTGTSGATDDNGWYTTDVELKAPDGYEIVKVSTDDGTTWKEATGSTPITSVPITEADTTANGGKVTIRYYLKETATGGLSDELTWTVRIDKTLPTGKITIKENQFTTLLNNITFKHFFKETTDVAIAGADAGSGIKEIAYQKATSESTYQENGTWTPLTVDADGNAKFSIELGDSGEKAIVYARITDNAGNKTIINSDGVVVYKDATASATESCTRPATEDLTTKITVNGNTIASVKEETLDTTTSAAAASAASTVKLTDVSSANYTIVNDKIVLKAEYLNTLQKGTHKYIITYNPLGETYVKNEDAEGQDKNTAPQTSVINLTVAKSDGSVTDISDLSKRYDESAVGTPTFTTTNTRGTSDANVSIAYKNKGADDSTYTTTAPSTCGSYTVKVTVAADGDYEEAVGTKDFTINHKWSDTWTTVKAATTTATGKEQSLCEGCGQTRTRSIAKLVDSSTSGSGSSSSGSGSGSSGGGSSSSGESGGTSGTGDSDSSGTSGGGSGDTTTTLDPKLAAIEKSTSVSKDAPVNDAEIKTDIKDLVGDSNTNVFTDSEKSQIKAGTATARIWLEITKSTATTDEKTKIEEKAKEQGMTTASVLHFDANLYKSVIVSGGITSSGGGMAVVASTETVTPIHDAGVMVKISMEIPQNMRYPAANTTRTFYVIRLHDGETTLIDNAVYNSADYTMTFETDKFSSYAIVYKDVYHPQAVTGTTTDTQNVTAAVTTQTTDTDAITAWLQALSKQYAKSGRKNTGKNGKTTSGKANGDASEAQNSASGKTGAAISGDRLADASENANADGSSAEEEADALQAALGTGENGNANGDALATESTTEADALAKTENANSFGEAVKKLFSSSTFWWIFIPVVGVIAFILILILIKRKKDEGEEA